MTYQDQTLTCRDCGKPFVFSVRDQEFYAEKGFANPPTRCRDCRNLRKQKNEQGAGPASGAPKPLFKITCKKCGKTGEMATEPHKPNDVLCSDCFYTEFSAQQEKAGTPIKPAKDPNEEAPTEEAVVDGITPDYGDAK